MTFNIRDGVILQTTTDALGGGEELQTEIKAWLSDFQPQEVGIVKSYFM